MIQRDDRGMIYLQVSLASCMYDECQIALDVLRADLNWGDVNQRALFAFHYVRHESDRWSIQIDLMYFRLEYDSMYGFQ